MIGYKKDYMQIYVRLVAKNVSSLPLKIVPDKMKKKQIFDKGKIEYGANSDFLQWEYHDAKPRLSTRGGDGMQRRANRGRRNQ
jgi:hypothetical protein